VADPLAAPSDVAAAWRPLSTEEAARAEFWLEAASRRIRRRWRDVDERIALTEGDPLRLDAADVTEVVVTLVIDVLGGPEIPHARAMSMGSGSESRSVQLGRTGAVTLPEFAGWMVEVFEGPAGSATPVYCMPRSLGYDRVFVTKEGQG
jgi:hypothetical protein